MLNELLTWHCMGLASLMETSKNVLYMTYYKHTMNILYLSHLISFGCFLATAKGALNKINIPR